MILLYPDFNKEGAIVMGILITLLSNGTHLIESMLIKKYDSKHSGGGFFFTAIVSFFSMMFFVLTSLGKLNFSSDVLIYGLIAGVFYCSASFLTYVSYSIGSFALTSLILSYSILVSIAYGIFALKEDVGIFMAIGLALLMISFFLSRKKSSAGDKRFSTKWLICILASALLAGLFGVVKRIQQIEFDKAYDNEFMIIALAFSTIIMVTAGIVTGGLKTFHPSGILYAMGAGFSNGATNLIGLLATGFFAIPISLYSPLSAGVKIILSFIISGVVYKEKFLKRQIVGVILGTAALVLLNLK